MKERPVLFNAEMVKAILSGRKTQTRRVMKNQPAGDFQDCPIQVRRDGDLFQWFSTQYGESTWFSNPLGQPGDQLWVRETWQAIHDYADEHGNVDERRYVRSIPKQRGNYWHPVYAASWGDEGRDDRGFPWRPSLHMPRWASRINLLITGVRVERLSSITTADAKAEGYPTEREIDGGSFDPWLWFHCLWDGIYPENTFKANPWVWVIEFQKVDAPIKSGSD